MQIRLQAQVARRKILSGRGLVIQQRNFQFDFATKAGGDKNIITRHAKTGASRGLADFWKVQRALRNQTVCGRNAIDPHHNFFCGEGVRAHGYANIAFHNKSTRVVHFPREGARTVDHQITFHRDNGKNKTAQAITLHGDGCELLRKRNVRERQSKNDRANDHE